MPFTQQIGKLVGSLVASPNSVHSYRGIDPIDPGSFRQILLLRAVFVDILSCVCQLAHR